MIPAAGFDHRVVERQPVLDPALGRPAPLLVEGAPVGVDQQRIVRRVELHVPAAQPGELANLAAQQVGHRLHERVEGGIGLARALWVPEVGEQAGAGERDLRGAGGDCAQERELLRGEAAPLAQRLRHGHLLGPTHLLVAELVGVPRAPQPGVDAHPAEAVDGRGQLGLERLAAQLAVVDHREADALLHGNDVAHRRVLGRLQLGIREIARRRVPRRAREERLGPQQAPDVFGPRGDHRASIALSENRRRSLTLFTSSFITVASMNWTRRSRA